MRKWCGDRCDVIDGRQGLSPPKMQPRRRTHRGGAGSERPTAGGVAHIAFSSHGSFSCPPPLPPLQPQRRAHPGGSGGSDGWSAPQRGGGGGGAGGSTAAVGAAANLAPKSAREAAAKQADEEVGGGWVGGWESAAK